MTLYRASDALMKHRDVIEHTLFDRAQALFGFELTVTLYDLTNTYFEGAAATNPKAKRGRSKDMSRDGRYAAAPGGSAATVHWSLWVWCWMAAALCGVPKSSRVMWRKVKPWSRC
jgi:hypothetical protein